MCAAVRETGREGGRREGADGGNECVGCGGGGAKREAEDVLAVLLEKRLRRIAAAAGCIAGCEALVREEGREAMRTC